MTGRISFLVLCVLLKTTILVPGKWIRASDFQDEIQNGSSAEVSEGISGIKGKVNLTSPEESFKNAETNDTLSRVKRVIRVMGNPAIYRKVGNRDSGRKSSSSFDPSFGYDPTLYEGGGAHITYDYYYYYDEDEDYEKTTTEELTTEPTTFSYIHIIPTTKAPLFNTTLSTNISPAGAIHFGPKISNKKTTNLRATSVNNATKEPKMPIAINRKPVYKKVVTTKAPASSTVKTKKKLDKETKERIAKYALIKGIPAAAWFYKPEVGRELKHKTIEKYIRRYERRIDRKRNRELRKKTTFSK